MMCSTSDIIACIESVYCRNENESESDWDFLTFTSEKNYVFYIISLSMTSQRFTYTMFGPSQINDVLYVLS